MAGTILPGATALSEWSTVLNGAIGTCVEASETVMLGILKAVPVSPQLDQRLTADLQARHQAGASGATNYEAASQQLTRLGVPNQVLAIGQGAQSSQQLIGVLAQAAGRTPVLVGLPHASALQDAVTGNYYDAGVNGHGITVVGKDATGFIVADPNTPQATKGGFVHYTPRSLLNAGVDSLVIPTQTLLGGPAAAGSNMVPAIDSAALGFASSLPGWGPLAGGTSAVANASPSVVNVALNVPSTLGASIGGGIVAGVKQALPQDVGGRGLFIVAGFIVLALGMTYLFFGGNVAGASPAHHTARAAGTVAKVAAVAA